jgi:hypothetical protein
MGRIGQINTDFFYFLLDHLIEIAKKIRVNLPNPPHPFSHSITIISLIP